MKTILLMSCALCAGSQGWAMDIENSLTDAPGKSSAVLKDVEGEEQTVINSRTDSSYSDKDSLEEIKETSQSGSEGDALSRDSGNPSSQPPATKTHASNTITEKLKEGTQGSPDCVTAEPPKGFSVEWSPAEWKAYEALDQFRQNVGDEVALLLNSESLEINSGRYTPEDFVKEIVNNHSESHDFICSCMASCLYKELEYGNPPTVVTAAEKILDVLRSSARKILSEKSEEE